MNAPTEHSSSYAEAAAIYGYEEKISREVQFENDGNFPQGPGSPLPADRLARKQRHFGRRGGACHSDLLQSAVMACWSSPKEDDGAKPGLGATVFMSTSSEQQDTPSASSPRKRLRRTDKPKSIQDDSMVTGASDLLASLSMAPLDSSSMSTRTSIGGTSFHERSSLDFKRQPPVRRVSRRKSYTSVASGASDYDDEDFADLDD